MKILLVEDDDVAMSGYVRCFSKSGDQLHPTRTLERAKVAVAEEIFDVILLSLSLPEGLLIGFVSELKKQHPYIFIILIGFSIPQVVKSINNGTEAYLTKPVDFENLQNVLKKHRDRSPPQIQDSPVIKPPPFFGDNLATAEILNLAKIAAACSNVILLLGETGTGKGVFAHWIHDHSDRAAGPFVEVNCSSLKGDLLRSELFGHARGAFTSAVRDKEGLLEIADAGTLFLDEIGDMDAEVQAQLLKTIEERNFRRLGENVVRHSNFRLICATNRDLRPNGSGGFRQDLYYRICVFPIFLSGLRNRREEFPALCEYLLQGMGYLHLPLEKSLVKQLLDYSWPGNVRELKNVFERALMLAQGKILESCHFPLLIADSEVPLFQLNSQKLNDMEDLHILQTVEEFRGNMQKASNALGLSVSSLYRRLSKIRSTAMEISQDST